MNLKTLISLSMFAVVASFATANAQTFSVIHTFTGGGDGGFPTAGVTLRAGVLYGTASIGGTGKGTVYEITRSGSNWTTVPISLLSTGGKGPEGRVVFGPDGHPYGTTQGCPGDVCDGTVFNLIVPLTICKTANCFWKENVLYSFPTGGADGNRPNGDLIWDPQGNIYGTTMAGGLQASGNVYELTSSGNGWTATSIYSFSGGIDGQYPESGVIFDNGGNLLGTSLRGGTHVSGNVFKLTKSGNGWTANNIYDFQSGTDGRSPYSGLLIDSSGNLYGATSDGGTGFGGTVFELIPSGDAYTFKLLYSFSGHGGNSCGPWGTLSMDASGNLYGTTNCDGANNLGNVFKLTNTGNGWVYSSLYDFTGGNDGSGPLSNVTIDTDGTLYGTTYMGGAAGYGVVWMIKP
jgi:uncharacterized repeat protein (TIGR03803 family)